MTTRADALNDALERLAGYEYLDLPGPFACHGPMGAEVLSTLGHDDVVASWVEAYKSHHQALEAFPTVERLDPTDERSWRPALGDIARISDWAVMFRSELESEEWPEVLRRWLPRLMPGLGGALTHGIIRVGHAVRAISSEESPSMTLLAELAKGLALWAGLFTPLPGHPRLRGSLALDEALARVPRPPVGAWSDIEAGTFVRMGELDGFPEAVEALGPPASLGDSLSELTAASCRVILAYPEVFPVPLVHTLTPTGAVRTLLPYLSGVAIESLYAQLWQVNAAIIAGFTPPRPSYEPSTDVDSPTAEELVALAIEHQDPHVLKFTEASLRELAVRADPVYLLAARSVLQRTPAW
jgi:hypothetical protein